MKRFKLEDIYGDSWNYKCLNEADAIECFIAEHGKDRLAIKRKLRRKKK